MVTDFFHLRHFPSYLRVGKSSGSHFTPLINSDARSVFCVMLITSVGGGRGGAIVVGAVGVDGPGAADMVLL